MLEEMLSLRTLFIASVLPYTFLGLALITYAIRYQSNKGMMFFGVGLEVLAFTLFLLAFAGKLFEYSSTTVYNNVLWMSAYALMFNGVLHFRKVDSKRTNHWFIYSVIAIGIISFYFTYIDYNFSVRSMSFTLCLIFYSAIVIYSLNIKNSESYGSLPNRIWCLFYTVFIVWNIVYIFAVLLGEDTNQIFDMTIFTWVGRFIDQGITFAIGIMMLYLTSSSVEKQLRLQSRKDPLTQCFNRRALRELAPSEIARASRNKQAVSLVMCDIDHFKQFNDNYGHDMGDKVLSEFSKTLRENIRVNDVLVRYGGEEFLIIFPNTDLSMAKDVAEKLRLHIENLEIQSEQNKVLNVTASFGVATYTEDMNNWELLMKKADLQLYEAKLSGRNCVIGQ